MIRQIIRIDESICDGCGLCVSACHEGAVGIVDGKAKLLREDYCDGLGDCLPACPAGAIRFEQREAEAYNESAGIPHEESGEEGVLACGCADTEVKPIVHEPGGEAKPAAASAESHLNQWPAQIKLVPPNAPFFHKAKLLVSADCAAYAYGDFHRTFMKDKITLIGCQKLDNEDYAGKLTAILKMNDIRSVTIARMEVPCCGGIEYAVKSALQNCGKLIPWQVVTISTEGRIIEE